MVSALDAQLSCGWLCVALWVTPSAVPLTRCIILNWLEGIILHSFTLMRQDYDWLIQSKALKENADLQNWNMFSSPLPGGHSTFYEKGELAWAGQGPEQWTEATGRGHEKMTSSRCYWCGAGMLVLGYFGGVFQRAVGSWGKESASVGGVCTE